MDFEKYCRRLSAAVHSSTYKLFDVRIASCLHNIDLGIITETSAILHLHGYAMELVGRGEEWEALDDLIGYTVIKKGRVAQTKHKEHSPTSAREMRGDFDGPNYTKGRAVSDTGMVEHSLHMPKG
jgi:hypothetical protein